MTNTQSERSKLDRNYLKAFGTNSWTSYRDMFSWSHEGMLDIDLSVIVHRLNVDPTYKPAIQKRRRFNPERYTAISKKVGKLLKANKNLFLFSDFDP